MGSGTLTPLGLAAVAIIGEQPRHPYEVASADAVVPRTSASPADTGQEGLTETMQHSAYAGPPAPTPGTRRPIAAAPDRPAIRDG